jgi:hypothetical protein
MPNQHKVKALSWHPESAELAAWARAVAKRRGVALKVILDEALTRYRERTEKEENGEGHATAGQ